MEIKKNAFLYVELSIAISATVKDEFVSESTEAIIIGWALHLQQSLGLFTKQNFKAVYN